MEEKASFQEIIRDFVRKNLLFVLLVLLGVILVGIGLIQYFASKSVGSDIQFVSSAENIKGISDTPKIISVDVEGKVQKPGVYSLSDGARVQDALIAAGGMSSDADREYVSQHFNQAQKLTDGNKIYIPGTGEQASDPISTASNIVTTDVVTSSNIDNSGLININTATSEQLDTLPKIGPVTAQKIISGRPYGTKEELVGKKVLGQKTYDGLRDKIVAE